MTPTPKRSEILHFRATPEEKAAIDQTAGEAGVSLSEFIRQGALQNTLFPTQPAVEDHPPPGGPGPQFETYEQFMERRVGELVGDIVLPRAQAEEAADIEWREGNA